MAATDANPLAQRLRKLETIIATLDRAMQLSSVAEVTRAIARGFVEIGAVMSIIFEADGEELRVAARWPEEAADGLYARAKGGRLLDFRIPVSAPDNPYALVFRTQRPKILAGPEDVADHIVATYGVDPARRPAIRETLTGRAGAVLPIVAQGRSLGIAGINYADDLQEADRHLFGIFVASAATALGFKRDAIGKAAILGDLERAIEKERSTRAELGRAERLAALGEMSAVVAHEIRNPLAVIANSCARLRRHIDESDEARLLVGIADEEIRRIDRIIDNMRALCAPMEVKAEPVDLDELVERAVLLAGQHVPYVGEIAVQHRREGPLPLVPADRSLVTQALANLLRNAFEAAGPGGLVEICSAAACRGERQYARVAIRDDGAGIAPADQPRIFKPFFTTKSAGTGLGLAIVKRIVDAHGGSIDLRSELGAGTEVVIELPAQSH